MQNVLRWIVRVTLLLAICFSLCLAIVSVVTVLMLFNAYDTITNDDPPGEQQVWTQPERRDPSRLLY